MYKFKFLAVLLFISLLAAACGPADTATPVMTDEPATQAPTEAMTEEPTEAATDAPTEAATEGPVAGEI
ncbi:MAG TPA: hypothetical protein VK888_10615, partial [Anaerolineales bacterium]|nr:hypothetical protein [Anaerolineales bacterium]